jgi:hypothetical protein
MSGEALITAQAAPSALTAIDDWLRDGISPRRAFRQFWQPQFHCGRPPPAAEPRMRMRRLVSAAACDPASEQVVFALVGGIIHVDFHAEANLLDLRGRPGHSVLLHQFARQNFDAWFDPGALFERGSRATLPFQPMLPALSRQL